MPESSTAKQKYPSSNIFELWGNTSPFMNMLSWDKIITANKSGSQALSNAAKSWTEGSQEIAKKSGVIMQRNAENLTKFIKDVAANINNPEANIARHTDFANSCFKSMVDDSKELLEISAKYNVEASNILGKQLSEMVSECTSNVEEAVKKSTKETA